MPLWPLLAAIAVQTLATMALCSVPTLAPAIARDLGVDGAMAGVNRATAGGFGAAYPALAVLALAAAALL